MAPKVARVPARKNKKGLKSAATSSGYICHHCHWEFNADGYFEFNASESLPKSSKYKFGFDK